MFYESDKIKKFRSTLEKLFIMEYIFSEIEDG